MVAPGSRARFTVSTVLASMLVSVHHGFDGPVERAALGSEIVLIFDENDRRRFRIHLSFSPSWNQKSAPVAAWVQLPRYICLNISQVASASAETSAGPPPSARARG